MPEGSSVVSPSTPAKTARAKPLVRHELAGAVVGALAGFSIAVPLGMLTLAPLGAGFSGIGVAAGLISATVGAALASLLGSTAVLRSGPMTAVALVVSAVLAQLLVTPQIVRQAAYGPMLALAVASTCVVMAGLLQIAFGWLKLGQAIKFVPRPVLAGYRLGVALVIAITQWPAFAGTAGAALGTTWPHDFSPVVGLVTLGGIIVARRVRMTTVSLFVGLIAGTAVHQLLETTMGAAAAGATVRTIPSLSQIPIMWSWIPTSEFAAIAVQQFPSLILSAASVALVASLMSLMAVKVVEDLTGERARGNRELVAQGLSNVATGALGGSPVAGVTATTIACYGTHARTRWSGVMSSLLLLGVLLFAGPATSIIPFAAVAAVMMMIAWDMLDVELLRYARSALSSRTRTSDDLLDVGIAFAVAGTSVAVNVVAAVGVGVLISVAVFAVKSSYKIVRREASGTERRSGRQRNAADTAWLNEHGEEIRLLELEGPIFFGTADALAVQVERRAARARYVILDFARVNAVDPTAAHSIGRIAQRLAKDGRRLLITSLAVGDRRRTTLERDRGVRAAEWLEDIDRGLEWCEDRVLLARASTQPDELPFHELDICSQLDPVEIKALRDAMTYESHDAGSLLFRQGEEGDCLYVLAKGSVTIALRHGSESGKRIVTFAPGVVFGEMALIDGSPRSADATCDVESTVYALSRRSFETLRSAMPSVAAKLYAALAVTLSMRLRRTTQELRLLAAQ